MNDATDCDAGLHQWSVWRYDLNNHEDFRYCYNCDIGMSRYRVNR